MGRRDKQYSKSLHQQAYDKLTKMQSFGESKKEAVKLGTDKDKIFSYNTYKTYWKHTKYFIDYVKEKHPEVTTLKGARQYVNEWLDSRADKGLSAWTIYTEAMSVGKLYGISPTDKDYYTPPKRERADIKRSRGDRARDRHFSKENNDELIKFCRGTGLRRNELKSLKGGDIMSRKDVEALMNKFENKGKLDDREERIYKLLKDADLYKADNYVYIRNGKGGRERLSPIVTKNAQDIADRIRNTPKGKAVWQYVNTNADIHSYRADYATTIYKATARDIKDIPYDKVNAGTGRRYQSDVYTCRKDEAGKKLDRQAMLVCSKALGHNRVSVVADNYIRGL